MLLWLIPRDVLAGAFLGSGESSLASEIASDLWDPMGLKSSGVLFWTCGVGSGRTGKKAKASRTGACVLLHITRVSKSSRAQTRDVCASVSLRLRDSSVEFSSIGEPKIMIVREKSVGTKGQV